MSSNDMTEEQFQNALRKTSDFLVMCDPKDASRLTELTNDDDVKVIISEMQSAFGKNTPLWVLALYICAELKSRVNKQKGIEPCETSSK